MTHDSCMLSMEHGGGSWYAAAVLLVLCDWLPESVSMPRNCCLTWVCSAALPAKVSAT